jgi:putative peptidoglycan lipid II flippase
MSVGSTIARATVLILALSMLSRIFGLGREMAIAYGFGTGGSADAFFVAYLIPYIFYGVIGVALTTVIVPVFAEYAASGRREEAWRMLSLVTNTVFLAMAALAAVGILGAPVIAGTLGAGFKPETLQLATRLTAVMMPAIVFMTVAGVFAGILNANKVFGPPAFGPAAQNLTIIAGALFGGKLWGIYGLAGGAVAGAVVLGLVQLPALRHVGFRYSFLLDFRHPEVRRVTALILPVILMSGIMQVYTMVDWRLASGLAAGSISALNYANKLVNLPQGLFVTAVATAVFPTLSQLVAEKQRSEMARVLQRAMKVILLLGVPGAIGLIVLREPVVALLFERGAFDAQSTVMTSGALLYYAIGLAGLCLNLPLTRGFFAMHDTKTPFLVSAATLLVKITLSLILVRFLQHAGLALATSLTVILNMFIFALLLKRRLPGLFNRPFFNFTGRVLVSAGVMGLVVYWLDGLLAGHLGIGLLALVARVGTDIFAGAAVFIAAGLILRLDELLNIIRFLYGTITRRTGMSCTKY